MRLREYQIDAKRNITEAWAAGAAAVLLVMPTGAGKTVTLSDIVKDEPGAVAVVAHRQELVAQISLALARDQVKHSFIGPSSVIRLACAQHVDELGRSYYQPQSAVRVVGVDTLMRRIDKPELRDWIARVSLWVTDEAHHIAGGNKWHKAVELFPRARGLGVTATPLRADGQGLGRGADGVFDAMVLGPGMADLIAAGFLTPYKLYGPLSDVDLSAVPVSASTGDYNTQKMAEAVRKSHLVGDVVGHYKRLANGKCGVTFASDVTTAGEIADQYNAAGVPAAVVHAKTPDAERMKLVRKLRAGELTQLVNVDIFGEGFDLPAIEVVSMARPTASYGLFVQQFGRALRPMAGKRRAIIIDHVGNIERMAEKYGLPDNPPTWTLDRTKNRRSSVAPDDMVKACASCSGVYERYRPTCPYCGYRPVPADRSAPERVDGDLTELDPAALASLREKIREADATPAEAAGYAAARRMPLIAQKAHVKRHVQQQEAQAALREAIAWWAAYQRAEGRADAESYRRFFINFSVDVLTAQTLPPGPALALADRVVDYLAKGGTRNA